MKVCEKCGDPIDGLDGDNMCKPCDEGRKKRNARARAQRRANDEAMRSLGLTKVRGAMGGVYWE